MALEEIEVFIAGRSVPLTEIRAFEGKEALRACRALGVKPVGATLPELRQQLAQRRAELGHDGIRARLARQIALSDRFSRLLAWLSRGKRKTSQIEIICPRGSAEGFVGWFSDLTLSNREEVMCAAEPQHYLIARHADGRQEVIETNGGAPMAARFFIDYDDLSSLTTRPSPDFPVEAAGVARTPNGTAIGGVRHMFRNEGTGLRARLIVEFPALTPSSIIAGHRWHLACEFSNWFAAWLAEKNPAPR